MNQLEQTLVDERSKPPRPGTAVRGSSSGRPIMALLDLLGRRLTLRILWELRDGPLRFRALQACCDQASPTVINTRLAELKAVGIIALVDEGYALTGQGKRLLERLAPLDSWAKAWSQTLP